MLQHVLREIIYTDAPLEGGRAYIECQIDGFYIFIVDIKAEAKLEPWLRQETWNRIFALAENPKTPMRVHQQIAEVVDIEDLRARRHGIWRVGQA